MATYSNYRGHEAPCHSVRTQVLGLPHNQNAHWSELGGINCDLMVTKWLVEVHVVSGMATYACDGLVALNNSFAHWALNPKHTQFDLLLCDI